MQIVIHAGMQKTGSTAIQDYLDVNRDALAGLGILYPHFHHRSHHFIAKALSEDPKRFHRLAALTPAEDSPARAAAALETLRGLLADPPADKLVLSHEGFSVGTIAQRLADLLGRTAPGSPAAVLAYVRNPVDHYPSAIQNALRSANARIAPPSRWRSGHPARAADLFQAFGDRVTLRLFSRGALTEGDVVSDFAAHLDRAFEVSAPKPVRSANNSSLSAAACSLLYIALAGPGGGVGRKAFGQLRGRTASVDGERGGAKLTVPSGWTAELAARNAEAWNRLVPRLDLSESGREAARIDPPTAPVAQPTTNRDLHDWLLSFHDPELVEAVTRRIAQSGRPDASAIVAWLSTVPGLVATGFAPDPAIFTPAR